VSEPLAASPVMRHVVHNPTRRSRAEVGPSAACPKPRAAGDFATIRARMEELRRERERGEAGQTEVRADPPMRPPPKYLLARMWSRGLGRTGIAQFGPMRG
jgi:hypothetical protein